MTAKTFIEKLAELIESEMNAHTQSLQNGGWLTSDEGLEVNLEDSHGRRNQFLITVQAITWTRDE
jgi:hypothetical protein